ncbi:hemolysin type calcium-binding protein [Aliiruegeria haliotis]|uniref:Hemolysin type calcium-binding protein n=1 Tax=Aliiruegeria haliotis TaxID=1280846 RepID=A0A2T0RIH5_9RHOB|nr:hypothetical protein [Aliiruegeria haliotis]PRY20900.1 hemolysin type calcium-binding protein [Aliiruegeria haliotis]
MPVVRDIRAILAYHEDEQNRWNANEDLGTSAFVAYRFATNAEIGPLESSSRNQYNGDFRVFTPKEKAAFREAVKVFEKAAGIRLVETANTAAKVVAFGADLNAMNPAGYAYVPFINTGTGTFDDPIDQSLHYVINMAPNDLATNKGFRTVLHELGHSLGLSHPFEAPFTLASNLDNTDNTVMSYTHTPVTGRQLAPMDIEAMRHLYGPSSDLKGWTYSIKKGVFKATGTKADEEVVGLLHFKNNIKGGAGKDLIVGWEKRDILDGGGGNDTLKGARGNDLLKGGAGNDTLLGDENDPDRQLDFGDTLLGGGGKDKLRGMDGNDILKGGKGNDMLWGDQSDNWWINDDKLYGGGGNDQLWGGVGDDTLKGERGRDKLYGGDQSDKLIGGGGNDRLDGGKHNDTLSGGAGPDIVKGGAGRDTISGGGGADILVGDDGPKGKATAEKDTFVFTRADRGARDKITDFDLRLDAIDVSAAGFASGDLQVKKVNGNVLLSFDGGSLEIVLQGIRKAQVDALSDFELFA